MHTLKRLLVLLCLLMPFAVPAGAQISRNEADQRYAASRVVQSGLIAEYRLDEGSGSTLKDSSGNGNAATFNGTTDPTWISGGGLAFGASNSNKYVPLPAALNAAKTIQIFCVPRPLSQWLTDNLAGLAVNPTILNPSVSNGVALSLFGPNASQAGSITPGIYSGTGGFGTQANGYASGPTLLTWTFGSGSNTDRVWINGVKETVYSSNSGTDGRQTTAGGNYNLGGGPALTGFSNTYFQGDIQYVVAYSRVLSDTEIRLNNAAIQAIMAKRGIVQAYGPNTSTTNQLVAIGDSITWGQGTTPYHSTGSYDLTWNVTNLGVSGSKAYSYRRFFKTDVLGYLSTACERNVISFFLMTNDGASTSTSAAYCAAIADAQKSFPTNTDVVLCTILARTSSDTNKNTDNPILRRAALANGWLLADFGSIPELGADGAAPAGASTYFQDGLHPTQAGQNLMKAVFAATVNYAPYRDLRNPFTTSSTTYAMTAKDAWLIYLGATGGNVTLTPATGHTGERRRITNATANSLTLTAQTTYTELVNGATTYTVPAGGSVTLVSKLRSDAAGGCDWYLAGGFCFIPTRSRRRLRGAAARRSARRLGRRVRELARGGRRD